MKARSRRHLIRMAAFLAAAMAVALCACTAGTGSANNTPSSTSSAPASSAEPTSTSSAAALAATDYSDPGNWLRQPEAKLPVDTIYIYPTEYADPSEGAAAVCDIENEQLRSGAADTYVEQATVYEDNTNVFAPFYRQINGATVAAMTDQERQDALSDEPLEDVEAALDYYFENLNGGRPFILASHSQGSQLMLLVLSDYMGRHPEYLENMVAAYVLGYSVTDDYLKENPHLRFAEGTDDTGVIVSWNTEGEANADADSFVVVDGAISINPLNWKRDGTYAPASENLGARVKNAETGEYEIIPAAADAAVNVGRGVVVTHTDVIQPIDASLGFGLASYHNGDYSLWYCNIADNVAKRIAAWNAKA